MADLTSKKLIVAKGMMFLIIALVSFALILIQLPSSNTALLLVCLVWGVMPVLLLPVLCAGKICQSFATLRRNFSTDPSNLAARCVICLSAALNNC